jgi:hypothetical protein
VPKGGPPPKSVKCPWKWEPESRFGQKPETISVAKCPNCDMTKCKEVNYYHNVLVQCNKLDGKTGEMVWKWKMMKRPIAYIYIL